MPREMTVEEIKTCVEQFRQGAINCIEAGFDGVEVRICWGDDFVEGVTMSPSY